MCKSISVGLYRSVGKEGRRRTENDGLDIKSHVTIPSGTLYMGVRERTWKEDDTQRMSKPFT